MTAVAPRWKVRGPAAWATLRLAARGRPVVLGGLVAVIVLSVMSSVVVMVIVAALVSAIPEAVGAGAGSEAGVRLLGALSAAAVLSALRQALASAQFVLAERLSLWLEGETHRRVMTAAAAPAGIGHLQDAVTADGIATAHGVGPFDAHAGYVVIGGAEVASQWLLSLASAVVTVVIFPPAGLVLLVVALLLRRHVAALLERTTAAMTGGVEGLRRVDYFRDLAMEPASAKEVRIFGLQAWVIDRFDHLWQTAMEPAWLARREGWGRLLAMFGLMGAVYGGATLWLGRNVITNSSSLFKLTLFTQALFSVASLSKMTRGDYQLAHGQQAVPALHELERRLSPLVLKQGGRSADGMPAEQIRLDQVTFTYPGGAAPVLTGLDLTIPAGRSLAVVGANGAGKTTLIGLLARFFEPDSGRITVDGVDLAALDLRSWHGRLAAIFQDFVRFDLPARDNVAFDVTDQERLARAARQAGAEAIINSLPHGWDTVLSRQHPDGANPSGGQWQRIALARAFAAVTGGADVLVLDEPTANLDVRAEAALYERFLDLTHGLTTIIVSHRFSTVRQADRIVVLDGGKIVEQGTHTDLLAEGGHYARMFRTQAAAYE